MTPQPPDPAFARDVREGLTSSPKQVPPKWLYDDRGSKLFERITQLDEYYLTDVEREIFRTHAGDIVAACPPVGGLVELGAGSAEKTRLLLEALADARGHATYWPIDISAKALEMAAERFTDDGAVTVSPVEAEFVDGLAEVPLDGPRLVAFIGSSIGNLPTPDQRQLLAGIRGHMDADDRLLLGTDLAKDVDVMLAAYDDREGVTARFTLNLLRRMNRELGADFDLDAFRHVAEFDASMSAVRIWAESQADQTVRLDELDLEVAFEAGERIHVEDSHKYTDAMLGDLFDHAGLAPAETFQDGQGWFAEHLLEPV